MKKTVMALAIVFLAAASTFAAGGNWENLVEAGISFPQSSYGVTGGTVTTSGTKYSYSADYTAAFSSFDAQIAWMPMHRSGFTFRLGLDYGLGFTHARENVDANLIKSDMELTTGLGFTLGKQKFRLTGLFTIGFGFMQWTYSKSTSNSTYRYETESDYFNLYFAIGGDVGVTVFFDDSYSLGLYLGCGFHGMPGVMDGGSSSYTVTTRSSGSSTTTKSSFTSDTTGGFRAVPVVGLVFSW